MKKKLLNEVLPDPEQAARDLSSGSPRARTSAHLKRIVAAAAALQLGTAAADNTVPGGDKGKNDKPPDAQKPPEKPPERQYMVVDPVPPPYIDKKAEQGWLRIESKPAGAQVLVDGEVVGTTPIKKLKVTNGMHAITVKGADGSVANRTVEVKPGSTINQKFDLRTPKK